MDDGRGGVNNFQHEGMCMCKKVHPQHYIKDKKVDMVVGGE